MSEQTTARLRWCLGVATGVCFGFLLRGGKVAAESHPWITAALLTVGTAALMLDWLVLDDNDGEYWERDEP